MSTKFGRSKLIFKPQQYYRPGVLPEQIKEMKASFDLFQTDNEGCVNPRDLLFSLKTVSSDARSHSLYSTIENAVREGITALSFEQFLDMMIARISTRETKETLKRVFNMFDDQQQGLISIKTLRKIVQELGENIEDYELREMIDKADSNKDGFVTEEDFYMLMTKKGKTTNDQFE